MTDRTPKSSERPGAKPEDEREPEVEVELVKDLDVPQDDEDGPHGGKVPVPCSHTMTSF